MRAITWPPRTRRPHSKPASVVTARLAAFEPRCELSAKPFEWKFTRNDLALLMKKLADKPDYPAAA